MEQWKKESLIKSNDVFSVIEWITFCNLNIYFFCENDWFKLILFFFWNKIKSKTLPINYNSL